VRRRAEWQPAPTDDADKRGWPHLCVDHVLQAIQGCDLDFLSGGSGSRLARRSH